jgi:hypothetical protein
MWVSLVAIILWTIATFVVGYQVGSDAAAVPETSAYANSEISAMHPSSDELTGYECIDRNFNSELGGQYYPGERGEFARNLGAFVRSQKREGNEVVVIASDSIGPYGIPSCFHLVARPCVYKCEPPSGINK